jgi:hypothetical protein
VENIDPNAGSSELANGFMERLKNLRERYNLKRDDDPAAGVAIPGAAGVAGDTGACVSADELRLRLAATRTRSFAPLAAADTTISNAAPYVVLPSEQPSGHSLTCYLSVLLLSPLHLLQA